MTGKKFKGIWRAFQAGDATGAQFRRAAAQRAEKIASLAFYVKKDSKQAAQREKRSA